MIELGEDFPCIAESIDAGRHAAIDRDLHEHLANFLARGTVGQRAPNMGLEFVGAVERAQHREVEKAARLVRKPVAAPHGAPGTFRNVVLHRLAEFVGSTNFFGGTVTSVDGSRCTVSSAFGEIKAHAGEGVSKSKGVIVSVRPEDVELSEREPATSEGDNIIRATVHSKDFLGEYLDFHVKVGDVVLQAKAHPSLRTPTGDAIYLRMKAHKCVAIPGVGRQ